MPDAKAVEVLSLARPTANGGSSEIYFATLEVRCNAGFETLECVVRIKPHEYRLFLRENFATSNIGY